VTTTTQRPPAADEKRRAARPRRGAGVPPSSGKKAVRHSTDAARSFVSRFEGPLTSYYLVVGATVALVCIGLVMVLSSSSVDAIRDGESPFTVFWRQTMFAVLGVPLTVLATRVPQKTWQALAWPMLVGALLLQLLVFSPLGKNVNGNLNWIAVGGFTLQPAEAGKLALVVWAATVLTKKRLLLHDPVHALVPVVPGAALFLLLVLAGHDLGTSLVVMVLVGTLLFVAGAPMRIFAVAGGLAAAVTLILVSGNGNRTGRISNWASGCSNPAEALNTCLQPIHGQWALASGGWWGVGLGGSREKWGLLPEAHNDFIFAIIGEELGLAGTLVVLGLFAILGWGLFRIVFRTDDLFIKIATGGVLVWVLGQAIVNIGAVIGLLPVVGVPLPLVSYGGSALVVTMVALGMVIGFARREPACAEALSARPGLVHRSLAVLPVRRGR
jgi:cell division protein FtsW